ncbi:MAG: alpha-amylase family glycosyl hydrolase [Planctomycetota bacterium]
MKSHRLSGIWILSAVVFFSALSAPVQAQTLTTLTSGTEVHVPFLLPGQWKYFRITALDWQTDLDISVQRLAGNPEVYVRFNALPTQTEFDYKSENLGNESVHADNFTDVPMESGVYVIGVYGGDSAEQAAGGMSPLAGNRGGRATLTSFKITATLSTQASSVGGMGALPFEGGSAFRVWAPFATSVHVAGDFNGWSNVNAPLVNEGNGHWSMEHRDANPGHKYKYVIRNGTDTIWRNDPREQGITNSVGDSVIYDDTAYTWNDSGFTMPNWNELVIYEMHVGTLNDSPGGTPGNFNSAIARLDHVRDLGINAVCVMPVHEFPGDFSWGYNPSYPFTVESVYGGPDEFKRFVDEAHQRGIAVLIDLVHNHYGPTDMDLWQFDGWNESGWGGIYFYNDTRASTPWGDTRPDFGRGEVRQYIRDNVLMWLGDFHADGLRMDSTSNIHTTSWGDNADGWSLLQWINDEIDNTQPWKIAIAEDLQNNAFITRDTGAGGAGFDAQWSAGFVHPIRGALQAGNDSDRNMLDVRNAIAEQYSGDAYERVVYTESHDEVANGRARVPEDIWPGNADSWPSQKRSTLGAVLVMSSPGIPMIFQGQEVLEDEYFRDDDPVDWSKEVTHAGIELMYRDLIRLRRNWFNHTRGLRGQSTNVHHVNNNDKMIAFHRFDQGGAGDDVIIVCNFSSTTRSNYRIGLPRGGTWRVRFNSDWNGYSSIFGNHFTPDVTAGSTAWDGMNFSGEISIAPYSAVILSQD